MSKRNIQIPAYFFNTRYEGSRHPGNIKKKDLKEGANCQYFVYKLLEHFGLELKDFRSKELWEDTEYTKKVKKLSPLDIVFFNSHSNPYGAHIGLSIGGDKVIHLSKKVGYPTVWDFSEFSRHPEYSFFIGAKRIKKAK